jgi:hypothetical protein
VVALQQQIDAANIERLAADVRAAQEQHDLRQATREQVARLEAAAAQVIDMLRWVDERERETDRENESSEHGHCYQLAKSTVTNFCGKLAFLTAHLIMCTRSLCLSTHL